VSDIKDELEMDIINFFQHIENQDINTQKQTLRNLFDKYIHLTRSTYMMDSHDLRQIISNAKSLFSKESAVIYLKSGSISRKVQQDELANLFVIESTISHLSKKECLKKLPKFDKKEK
jgi:hypothetical protein